MAVKCQIPVPDFKIIGTIEDSQALELLQTPGWEQREDVILYSPDCTVMQFYYFDGEHLQHPLIGIDDPYIMSGRMGGKLDGNLMTMFSGELKLQKHTPDIAEYLKSIGHKGFITLTFSIFDKELHYSSIQLGVPDDFIQNTLNLYNLSFDWYIADLTSNSLPAPKGISVSLRLYSSSYYKDNNMSLIHEFPIPGAYELTDCFALSYWQDKFHIKDAWGKLYHQLNDPTYTHNGICYNTDGGYKARKVYDILKKARLLI